MIHLPTLTALRYENEEPKPFKSLVGVRKYPLLSKGDIIVIPSLTAHLIRKNNDFTEVDLNEVLGANVIVIDPADEETQEETKDEVKDPADEETQEETKDEVKDPADEGTQEETNAPATEAPKAPKIPKPRGKQA